MMKNNWNCYKNIDNMRIAPIQKKNNNEVLVIVIVICYSLVIEKLLVLPCKHSHTINITNINN